MCIWIYINIYTHLIHNKKVMCVTWKKKHMVKTSNVYELN